MTPPPPVPVSLPNSAQHLLDTDHGTLQIMVAWPLAWAPDGSTTDDVTSIPLIFVLDANAYFLTAVDITRRIEFTTNRKKLAVVVGIGYPDSGAVYNYARRNWDLTPPPARDEPGEDGVRYRMGGAAHFQTTLTATVFPALPAIVPAIPFGALRKALFGHSFGALFALYSLRAAPGVFDVYVAASPSLWLEADDDFCPAQPTASALYITTGLGEGDDVRRKTGESGAAFARRRQFHDAYRMNGRARELAARLRATGLLAEVWHQEFALEDHGSAAVCGLQRGINRLLGEWWADE